MSQAGIKRLNLEDGGGEVLLGFHGAERAGLATLARTNWVDRRQGFAVYQYADVVAFEIDRNHKKEGSVWRVAIGESNQSFTVLKQQVNRRRALGAAISRFKFPAFMMSRVALQRLDKEERFELRKFHFCRGTTWWAYVAGGLEWINVQTDALDHATVSIAGYHLIAHLPSFTDR